MKKIAVLDGWRGISILLVLAGHLLPLKLAGVHLNSAVAGTGMAIFFILSGFLITSILMADQNIKKFLIRRFLRIVPLAWLVLIITFAFTDTSVHQWASSLFFYANWPPMGLTTATSHYWSLCVEVQFYITIAILAWILRDRFWIVLPVLCIGITLFRWYSDKTMAINTYFRVDEILAGCILAIVYKTSTESQKRFFNSLSPLILFPLLICSAHNEFEVLNYFRPYIALLLVGSTLFAQRKCWWQPILTHKLLVFIAGISYALYVIHGGLRETWLGEGDMLEKYLKRPLFIAVTFALAYLSTKYYESYWIKLGKKLS